MSKLKSNPELVSHSASFQGITPERKKEIVDHLIHLPETHHEAVRKVLESKTDDPETNFVRGCFADATPAEPPQSNGEHPGLPDAA